MRYVTLKKEEIEVLEHLHQNCLNATIRKRSQCLVLSHQKRNINDLASIFKVSRRTIERWFDSWAVIGIDSLGIAEGRGAKTILKDYSIEVSEQLELHNRNLKNVLIYFEEKHNIIVCKKTLQNFLKVTGL
ncbi:helix-turn-helix domain-containing protein [Flavobacterium soyangense]|uniref:Helix-turn-helix domain-containing protein n=1 Tax=Flavobacterium soyangense TaxID=2023265 RepID=A0A930UC68_9FLAO|nr:helix-turn-helix domain-containing protein [Flavobacterium soyangense]MBF2709492.1 helix-turn-helix domain-containing protein [Flavobacterium soyangense]